MLRCGTIDRRNDKSIWWSNPSSEYFSSVRHFELFAQPHRIYFESLNFRCLSIDDENFRMHDRIDSLESWWSVRRTGFSSVDFRGGCYKLLESNRQVCLRANPKQFTLIVGRHLLGNEPKLKYRESKIAGRFSLWQRSFRWRSSDDILVSFRNVPS